MDRRQRAQLPKRAGGVVRDDNEMSDNAEKKQSWWLTLPGVLTAMTGFIGAITALIIGLNQVGLIGWHVSPTTTSAPATPVTSTGPQPPSGVPLISLPAAGADWQGFLTAPFSLRPLRGRRPRGLHRPDHAVRPGHLPGRSQ
jgi:hypothetical protein